MTDLNIFKNLKIPTMNISDKTRGIDFTESAKMASAAMNSRASNLPSINVDSRSRAERLEDLDKALADIDLDKIRAIVKVFKTTDVFDDSVTDKLKSDVTNTLEKFARYFNEFQELNSEGSRKIELKQEELKLEVQHDWKAKWRLFFFRVLATVLFISTLFVVGYIEHSYDWARLPMSKYLNTSQKLP